MRIEAGDSKEQAIAEPMLPVDDDGPALSIATSDAGAQGLHLSRPQCTEQINVLERQKRDIENALAELRRAYSSHDLSSVKPTDAG